MQGRNGDSDVENGLVDPVEEEEGGMNGKVTLIMERGGTAGVEGGLRGRRYIYIYLC